MSYDDVYNQVIAEYKKTGSVSRAARNTGTTLVRAQRILITERLWSSETSRNVGKLYAEGKSVEEIAAKLFVSKKTVQAYLPYTRNLQGYGGDDRSADAVRAEKYRDRMHGAALRQVDKDVFLKESTKGDGTYQDGGRQTAAVAAGDVSGNRALETAPLKNSCSKESGMKNDTLDSKAEHVGSEEHGDGAEREANSSRTLDFPYGAFKDTYEAYRFRFPCVLRLSLELDISGISSEDKLILRKYGKARKGITRDVLVPADMTLHALHYVIMRAFGWENSHLHHFLLPGEIFNLMTGRREGPDQYGVTAKSGSIFRWADLCGIYFRFPSEDYDDIYWDDDYEEGISFRTWLRKKYTGPYLYGGYGEHYKNAHYEAEHFIKGRPLDEIQNKKVADIEPGLIGSMDELLERLKIRDVLIPQGIDAPLDLEKQILKLVSRYKEEGDQKKCGVIPVTHDLVYQYDYGDGWKVRIRLEDYYYTENRKSEAAGADPRVPITGYSAHSEIKLPHVSICNMLGINQVPQLSEQVMMVKEKRRPVCISLDGLPLMDDVGGVSGYIDFLRRIHEGEKEEAGELREWARGMGWTGRMNRPETLL